MSDIKLKPCPFCGGEGQINKLFSTWKWSVSCSNVDCPVHPETEGTQIREEAAEIWNRRIANEAQKDIS